MGGKYASGTSVTVRKSRDEIERTLERYGARAFGYATRSDGSALLYFEIEGVRVQLTVTPPDPEDFAYTETGRLRSEGSKAKAIEDEERRRWRVLLLLVKAKLEAVATGNTTIEREFMADLLLPDGRTVEQATLPAVRRALGSGQVSGFLPAWEE